MRMVGPDMVGVLLADVSGHGVPAGFICAMLKVAYLVPRRVRGRSVGPHEGSKPHE